MVVALWRDFSAAEGVLAENFLELVAVGVEGREEFAVLVG